MKYENVTGFKHGGKNKIGVLLVNLGTPKSPTAGDLRTYLREFYQTLESSKYQD